MTYRKYQYIFFIGLLLSSCKSNQQFKEVSFGKIKLTIPNDATIEDVKGIDSRVAYIIYKKDTFHLEQGIYAYKLDESLPTIFPISQKVNIEKLQDGRLDSNSVVYSEYPEEDREQNIFAKNYYYYDTINGVRVKIVQPKKIGNGMTGIYMPAPKGAVKFSMYSENLDSATNILALKIFRTIKF